ncbi:MAG TPA: gliding motility-associated C-terminal domain-containing protein [Bacteroidales bacterium]|nr:gliding motility-associated C-terminal domain-containing protein [Bacteroidales bacterium]
MKHFVKISYLLLFILLSLNIFGQENTLQHEMLYQSHDQNMWGPDDAYGIDVEHTFFDVDINESWGFSEISEAFGQQFGVGMNVGIIALLRSTFEAHGFYTGSFSLDYPIKTTLEFPEDFSFNYGGPATIHTSYEVTDGWALETSFPPVGVITLDFEYQFDPFMNIVVCVFSCDTIHLIPASVSLPYTLDTLFHINAETQYCVYPCYVGNQFTFCHDYELPIDIDFTDLVGFNFEAHVDLPEVVTEDYIEQGSNCLIAKGEDPYMLVELDVLGFLYVMAGYIPAPEGPQIQEAIAFLNDTIQYPINTPLGDIIFQIEYSLLSVYFIIQNTLHQDIYFCPTIWLTLDFPVEMPYIITDPQNSNAEVENGFSDTITMAVGNDLTITYPCHDWDSMYVGVKYNIQPTIRNHTWDSIAFSFVIEALRASISIITPFKSQIADNVMPSFELPINSETPVISEQIAMQGYYEDEEFIQGLEKDLGPWEIGPLFEWTISLGYVPVTWFDQTWELMHFEEDIAFPGTYIRPYDKSEVNSLLYTEQAFCYGETHGYIYAEAQNGIAPYEFQWSTGQLTQNSYADTDSIHGVPGYYTITVTDAQNCESYDSISVAVNPPIIHNLTASDLDCYGFFTGSITTEVTGGTFPYFFEWSNGSFQQNPTDLTSGWHYVTISDFRDCSVTDSIYINQPDSPITIDYTKTDLPCHGTDHGSIDITLSGATPPYTVLWSSGQTYQDLHNLSAGIYTITATDANNCSWAQSITIIEPDTLIANINSSNIPCFGLDNGSLVVQTSGGTQPYTYHWFHDSNQSSNIITNMHPGYYFVSVVDANGCSDTASAYITQPNELILTEQIHNVSCKGGHDGYITVNVSGGTPYYNIEWSNGYFSDSIGNLPIGTYTITVTDQHACRNIQTYTITEPANYLSSTFYEINNVSCFGYNDGNANVLPTGGTPPYTVYWEEGVEQQNFTGLGMPANTYFNITVVDANSCQYFDSIRFTQPTILQLTGKTDPVECGHKAGSGTVTPNGGTPPYTYLWASNETTQTATNLTYGLNQVIVKDANNCTDTLSLFVNKIGKIYGSFSLIEPNLCFNDSIAVAIAKLEEGEQPIQFVWSNGQIGDTARNLPAGEHFVFASDKYNCTDTISVLISEPDSLNPNFKFIPPTCSGIYDGEIEANPSGGTPEYSFLWDNNSTENKISELREGTYYISITDANNCLYIYDVDLMELTYCITIYNTITPNGDGANDTWIIENIDKFPRNKIWIYNRIGNLVFEAENYQNDWGGTYKGKDLPEGTYYYIIDLGDGKSLFKGHITIIR